MRDRLPVREVQLRHQQLVSTVPTNGRVEPDVNYQFHSPTSTFVKAVYVHAGDVVPAGKLLIQLDDLQAQARVAAAESGVKAAQAAVETAMHNGTLQERQMAAADIARNQLERDQARHDLDALVKLNSTGAASQGEVAAARERLDTAEANLTASQKSAQSHLSPAEVARAQAALTDAEANLAAARAVVAQSSYYAPIAGTVYSLDAAATDFVDPGKLLLQIADLHNEHVVAYFDEPWIGQLAVGQRIVIKWEAKPGMEWHGHITRTPSTVIVYGTRNVGEVQVQIDDGGGPLLPDTHVTVTVTTSSEPNALTLPRQAMYAENGKPYVFKVVNDTLVRTPVTTGAINLTQVAITSGLNEGDWVATGSTTGQPLVEGIPIKKVGP
ncbi:MAG: efflux RND transporter periplasmic adaptor subunit [Terracidiphilus sp.]